MRLSSWMASGIAVAVLISMPSWAQKKKSAPTAPAAKEEAVSGEMLEVEKVKEKYWAQGKDSKMGVVQNRLYSKEKRFALGLLGGVSMADPFLSIKTLGGTFGYHFSEFIGVSLVGWKNFVSASSALKTAVEQDKDQNTVEPYGYIGAEGLGSIMYGKLSLLGQKIIYYDMHLSIGAGMTFFESHRAGGDKSASSVSGTWGIGQRFYLTDNFSLRMDYRNQIYREVIREKVITADIGDIKGRRTVFAHTINMAVDFMF